MNSVFAAFVPPGVVTRTLTAPGVPAGTVAGVVAVIDVALFTVMPVAGWPPKVTAVAPVKALPVIVTVVPPSVVPELGDTALTMGGAM